jgi:lipoate-protein ligase A
MATSLKASFAAKFEAKLIADTLCTEEISHARWLAERKYSNNEWNLRR